MSAHFLPDQLERFAALVAAREREACAKVCDQQAFKHVEASEDEETEDLRERCLVYAKHIRRCSGLIRARAVVQPTPSRENRDG
jgi:acyl-CoA reductase-like NAD-dependent aldehyde dehydrogenase